MRADIKERHEYLYFDHDAPKYLIHDIGLSPPSMAELIKAKSIYYDTLTQPHRHSYQMMSIYYRIDWYFYFFPFRANSKLLDNSLFL